LKGGPFGRDRTWAEVFDWTKLGCSERLSCGRSSVWKFRPHGQIEVAIKVEGGSQWAMTCVMTAGCDSSVGCTACNVCLICATCAGGGVCLILVSIVQFCFDATGNIRCWQCVGGQVLYMSATCLPLVTAFVYSVGQAVENSGCGNNLCYRQQQAMLLAAISGPLFWQEQCAMPSCGAS
jgi:hypothetical protein